MIYVCDAIMGTGKTSAAIRYINDRPKNKFIYIAPFLEESRRIKDSCPNLHFAEPTNADSKYHHRKIEHTQQLISEGRNVATTHAAFKSYTPEMIDLIRDQEYTLIVDEDVSVLDALQCNPNDLKVLIESGYILECNETFTKNPDKEYEGDLFKNVFKMLETRELLGIKDSDHGQLYYWVLPPDLFTAFKNVFVLTYLFDGQSIHHFMNMHNIEYNYIGIHKDGDGFVFGDAPGYIPEYVDNLEDMINIYDGSMNGIGENFYALSKSWFSNYKNAEEISKLQSHIRSYMTYNCRDAENYEKMWATFKDDANKLKGKGYTKGFTNFNTKATNDYRDRWCMAYVVNVFMDVNEKKFYYMHGINVDEAKYALSIMVQWIWRSAIRDGQEIQLYLPSRRMRELLEDWIDSTMKGGNDIESNGQCGTQLVPAS